MPDRVVMRFTPQVMELYEQILAHAKECPACGPLSKGAHEVATAIHRLGCLTGVLLCEEWRVEYEKLHSEEEKRRHDRMTRDEVDALVSGIRGGRRG